ncbi:hypothetical protein F4781DRAFT_443380 [Annulohypoxylon bovei var. microspora]|nr:hypothetical protein F4781DRAFT_443380 [Annulohypoxylon bovei var. microspora]
MNRRDFLERFDRAERRPAPAEPFCSRILPGGEIDSLAIMLPPSNLLSYASLRRHGIPYGLHYGPRYGPQYEPPPQYEPVVHNYPQPPPPEYRSPPQLRHSWRPSIEPPPVHHSNYRQIEPPPEHHLTYNHHEPSSPQVLRPFPHHPRWLPNMRPHSPRHDHRQPPMPVITTPIDLQERPEHTTFGSEAELRARLTGVFRPAVGVVGRRVQEHLGLAEQPQVKFDLYPVQVDERGQSPALRWRTLSRGPVFAVTLPGGGTPSARLQDVSDALRDALAAYPNAWYRQAGYVFRESRRARRDPGEPRRRFWVPPACVYKFSRTRQCYYALFVEVAEENVSELDAFHDYGDTSEDDQGALVNEMWEDVRIRNSMGLFDVGSGYL